jgi:ParB family chromosome partitioning protein
MIESTSPPVVAVDVPALADLAVCINVAHRASARALRASVWHALGAGRLLIAAKAALPHGAWRARHAANVDCAERTAQLYMRLARDRAALAEMNPQRVADLWDASLRDAVRLLSAAVPDAAAGGERDADEWYTPGALIDAARTLLGGIDLDSCSCEAAQAVVRADAHFTKEDDGLTRPWVGRVWLNPPYAHPLVERFTAKLMTEHAAGRVTRAVILVNSATDAAWFAMLAECYPVLFTRGRVRFWRPDRSGDAPRYGQALFGVGVAPAAFAAAFADLAYAPNRSPRDSR